MESKRDKAIRLLKKQTGLLVCPVCSKMLSPHDDYTLRCVNGHSIDVSRKGTVNLTGKSNDKLYNSSLFQNRREIIRNGYYSPVINTLCEIIEKYSTANSESIKILDAGCGEGSFLNMISNRTTPDLSVGIDLSKSGIELATSSTSETIWLIDDLANIHMRSGSFNILLNILSPASYAQFEKIISYQGIVIKIIPGKNYLSEIRAMISQDDRYDNSDTLDVATKNMTIIHNENLEYTMHLSERQFENFINMTPMTRHKGKKSDHSGVCGISSPNEKAYGLTIDLKILVGKFI